jgi:hypothetical protein
MLGCQDFCGYYDWTFHYVRRRWGKAALERLWREAIGGDSQRHYGGPAAKSGLRALYGVWVKTGQDEHCDWTFTLDEEKNVLRWDMRDCPSKGFLIANGLHADEDYCDHCTGWVIPMLEDAGAELVEHEHNHCGQCWAVMRMKDRPALPLAVKADIHNDPRWNRGYIHRWENNQPLPSNDPCAALEAHFQDRERLSLWIDTAYNDRERLPEEPSGVLIGCPPDDLAATAARYRATAPADRPLLMHAYLPGAPFADFPSAELPRPVPILPLLIRKGKYIHRPGGPHPTTGEFLALLVAALGK